MRTPIDLSGQRFGRLIALDVADRGRAGCVWRCQCDCGSTKMATTAALRAGTIQSCGCLQLETAARLNRRHGQYKSPTYCSWLCMLQRCTNVNHREYASYGGRGITVCDQWRDFTCFLADMGQRPVGTTIDRIENSKNYEPGNCRWATPEQQSNNTRTVRRLSIGSTTRTLHEWAAITGINPRTIQKRLKLGWSDAEAVGAQ